MKTQFLLLILFITTTFLHAQTPVQTIRGRVTDKSSLISLPGASVIITGSNPLIGTTTDMDGNFRLENIPVGRYNLLVTYIGYNPAVISELLISSGKETYLEVSLVESVSRLEEVVVRAQTRKDRPLNTMASVSARSFTVEETRRYAGGLDDPARMASAFAGVATGNLQDNAIIIRGNSAKGVLWRVEGVEVPNPNHFSGGNVAGGGFTNIISSQLMANSDFYTGAFPAEYGNALAGVFDMKLRTGNTQRREYTLQAGMHGIDIAAEGPFADGKNSSYLANYRYSTFGLLSTLGAIPSEQIPIYQDLCFKLNLPAGKYGIFSLWGIGGIDEMVDKAEQDPLLWEHNMDAYDNEWNEKFGATGLNHRLMMGNSTYLSSSLAASGNLRQLSQQKLDEQLNFYPDMDLKDNTGKITFASFINHKFSARHTNRTGVNINTLFYNLDLSGTREGLPGTFANFVKEKGNSMHMQLFSQSKINISDQLEVNAGITTEYFALSTSYSFDPRLGINWQFAPRHAFSAGYGKHSQLESLKIYLISSNHDGHTIYPNKKLGFSHAHHFVLAYDWQINDNMRLKAEPYFQYLYDIPGVEGTATSLINFRQDMTFREVLANNTEGRNIGLDLTLERFLRNNFYYLITTSVFDSKYRGDDNVWRNTRYDRGFVANILAGKEFFMGRTRNNILGVNARVILAGGDRSTPILAEESNEARYAIFDNTRLFEQKEDFNTFLNLTVTYRINKNGYSSIFALQLNNALATPQNREYVYNYKNRRMEMLQDVFVLPGLSYKIEF